MASNKLKVTIEADSDLVEKIADMGNAVKYLGFAFAKFGSSIVAVIDAYKAQAATKPTPPA